MPLKTRQHTRIARTPHPITNLQTRNAPHLDSVSVTLPHPDRRLTGGEDATLQAKCAIGVFDGVSGTTNIFTGSDAGRYARRTAILLESMLHFSVPRRPLCHRRGVKSAVRDVARGNGERGACTIAVAAVRASRLHCLVLGDSRLLLVREGKVLFLSCDGRYSFNSPHHVSNLQHDNALRLAMRKSLRVREGDILIAATDGLWDNVFVHEVVEIVSGLPQAVCHPVQRGGRIKERHSHIDTEVVHKFSSSRKEQGQMRDKMRDMGTLLVERACRRAHSSTADTPFSRRLADDYGATGHAVPCRGGKTDDITVVVARVSTGSDWGFEQLKAHCRLYSQREAVLSEN